MKVKSTEDSAKEHEKYVKQYTVNNDKLFSATAADYVNLEKPKASFTQFSKQHRYRLIDSVSESSSARIKDKIKQTEDSLINDDSIEGTQLGSKLKIARYGVSTAFNSIRVSIRKNTSVKQTAFTIGKAVAVSANSEIRQFTPQSDGNQVGDAIITTKNAIYSTASSVKKTYTGAKTAVAIAKTIATAVTKTALFLSLPILLIGVAIISFFIIIIMPMAGTHPGEDKELNAVFKYATELQTDIQLKFLNYEVKNVKLQNITFTEEFTENEFVSPYDILCIFSAKYEDELTINKAKPEMEKIYNDLYAIDMRKWQEIIIEDDLTKPIIDPITGEAVLDENGFPTYEKKEVTIDKAEVTLLQKISFNNWMLANQETFFKCSDIELKDKIEYANNLKESGFIFRQSLLRPFEDDYFLSSRYGYRVDPNSKKNESTGRMDYKKEFHNAIDIPQPANTPIKSLMSGIASVGYSPNNYGNWVIITKDQESVRFAHCSSIAVANGQAVTEGDVIAFVGSTGATSTGEHVHIEYELENENMNPKFFIEQKET